MILCRMSYGDIVDTHVMLSDKRPLITGANCRIL